MDNLPDISINKITDSKNINSKCAPSVNFSDGSCLSLIQLLIMTKIHNEKHKNDVIPLNESFETVYPSKYKIYLVYELQKRYGDNQPSWIENKTFNELSDEDRNIIENYVHLPKSPQGRFEWLSNENTNEKIMQYELKYPDFIFLGTVPIDFETHLDDFKNIDFSDIEKHGKHKLGMIINLDRHDQSGSHWVSLFSDLQKGSIYFSDSTGTEPNEQISHFIQRIYKYIKSKGLQVDCRHNKFIHQRGNSECGVYSINFILRLLNGKTFEHITEKIVVDSRMNKCRRKYFIKR